MNHRFYQQAVPIMEDGIPMAVLAENVVDVELDVLDEEFAHLHAQDRAMAIADEIVAQVDQDGAPQLFAVEPLWVGVEDAGEDLRQGQLSRAERQHQRNNTVVQGRNAESISSYLFEMIREGHTCTAVLGGGIREEHSCSRVVERCVSHPEEAFYICPNGRTPLHEACLKGSCSHVISTLLQQNAMGASLQDSRGNTPLHLLFVDNSTQRTFGIHLHEAFDRVLVMASLLEVSPFYSFSSTNSEGNTALHMACLAPESMIPCSAMVQLLQANVSAASMVNNHNQPPLLLHCRRQNASTGTARLLYDACPGTLSTLSSDDGWAALHYVASNTNLNLLQLFLETTNLRAARVKTASGETALHLMCQQNLNVDHLPALDVLLGAYPDAVIQQDHRHLRTPLHAILCQAGSRTSLEVVKRLLDANPHVAEVADSDFYLPIHHACEKGCEQSVVAAILDTYPSAAYAMTRRQDSALSLACTCNKYVETVRMLIQANMDAVTRKNDYGFAPLHCVCRAYQPRMGIVQTMLDAAPNSIALQTHSGETPVHLACNNATAFVGVLQLLTQNQNFLRLDDKAPLYSLQIPSMTNKVGNTPLHEACFRGAPFEHIETLAMAHPSWIQVQNNGGLSPLQILCKNGRIDERIVTAFSRIGGPEIFSVIDSTGNTALHSAMREDTDLPTLKCLIRAFPDSLQMKTVYGDSPLHLACHRRAHPDVVREVALASTVRQHGPILESNTRGQTPISIAIEDFRDVVRRGGRSCWVTSEYNPEQSRVFGILATLVKILYYGPSYQDHKHMSLVRACVALHRQDVRLDPIFIRRAIHVNAEEVLMMDDDGTFPLHIESSIPVEKMFLLDRGGGCCGGECQKRVGILRTLLTLYPAAAEVRSLYGDFPLNLMIQNGRFWGNEIALALKTFPPALHWQPGLGDRVFPLILEKVSRQCGVDTLLSLLVSCPDMVSTPWDAIKKSN